MHTARGLGRHAGRGHAAERELLGEPGVPLLGGGVEVRVVLEAADEYGAAPHRARLVLEVAAEAEKELAAGVPHLATLGHELEWRDVPRVGVAGVVHRALGRRRGR